MSFLPEVELGQRFQPFATFEEDLGPVPNLLRAQSLLPRAIEGQVLVERAVWANRGVISRAQKERILLCIAAGRQDVYCAGLARTALRLLGEPDRQIDGLFDDHRCVDLPPAEVALLDFCLKLALHALSVSRSDVERLREHGIDDESIIEAAAITALAIYRCTLSVGLHPEPEGESWKLPPKREVFLAEPAGHGSPGARRQTGPYVRAPYLNPLTFAPFDALAKTHGFIPNFFRAQTLRPDILAAEVELASLILLPQDSYSIAEGNHLIGGLGGKSQLVLRDPLQLAARVRHVK
jgi:uncharacterized peroxidase-related enzyme